MKRLLSCLNANTCLRIVFLSFLITTTAYSEVFHNTADLAESKKIREEFNIVGIVTIADPDVVNEALLSLPPHGSEEEFEQKLMELLKEKPAVNAVVVARQRACRKTSCHRYP